MTFQRLMMTVGILVGLADPLQAARLGVRDQARQQAEHDCYDDVQRLCSNEIPDEARITAYMSAHRKQLSPQCGKDFDRGL